MVLFTQFALFVWLISHQPAVFFSQNKPVSSTFLSEQISNQPNEQAGWDNGDLFAPKNRDLSIYVMVLEHP
jgi:hypothetical protein